MTSISDEGLLEYASRVRGKVVLITGGGGGIGRETALLFAQHGAKVVIGDIAADTAQAVVREIQAAGREAIARKCNVAVWEDQVALFAAAIDAFGVIDVVIANAGINEVGGLGMLKTGKNGQPLAPELATLDVNITGVLFTTHLALHYLRQCPEKGALRSLVFIGSMASWQAVNGAPVYGASKHAVLGLMRSLDASGRGSGVSFAVVHPGFAETGLVDPALKKMLHGVPFVPVPQIARAILRAATDNGRGAGGAAWLVPDAAPGAVRVAREQLREGVYRVIDERFKERYRQQTQEMDRQKQARL